MAKFCGKCGSPLNSTAVFCGGCGTRVPVGAPAPAAPAMATPPAAPYTPVNPSPSPAWSEPAPEPAGFAPASAAFVATDSPVATPPDFSAVPASFAPAAEPEASSYEPVKAEFASVPQAAAYVPPAFIPAAQTPAPVAAEYAPVQAEFAAVPQAPAYVPPAFTPSPQTPAPVAAGYAPVNADFAAVPQAPAYAPPVPQAPATQAAAAYAPVAGVGSSAQQAQAYTPAQPPAQPAYAAVGAGAAAAAYTPGTAYPAAKKSNTLLKVLVAFVLLIFVGGALGLAGLWYAAQKIKEKAHAAAVQAIGGSSAGSSGLGQMLSGVAGLKATDDTEGFKGDPCRFLSTAEVSQATGVQVIRAEGEDDHCTYIAHGDPADATAKHLSSMAGGMGVPPDAQKQMQKIAGAFFAQQEAGDKDLRAQAATGEIPVLSVRFTSGNAEAEMKMNRGAFGYVTGGGGSAASSATGTLDGIGDDAYLAGGGMLIFRKGNQVAHFMYVQCPCNTDNIKPLAKLVASRM
jgi:hypothetical protein